MVDYGDQPLDNAGEEADGQQMAVDPPAAAEKADEATDAGPQEVGACLKSHGIHSLLT